MKNRLNVIICVLQGKTASETASYFSIYEKTVRNYVNLYNKGILNLLHNTERNGRNPKLNETQQKELGEVIKKSPSECGFDICTTWTCKMLKEYVLLTYNVKYTVGGIRALIRNMEEKFRFTRPTYVLAKANSEEQ